MKTYNKLSLANQLYVLYAVTISVILFSAVLVYKVSFRSLRNKENIHMNNMLTQVAQRTEDITSSIQLITDTVANSSSANHLLTETNYRKRMEYKRSLNSMINELARSNQSIKTILLLNTNEKVYGFNGFDYYLANQLDAKYDLFSFSKYPDGFSNALTLPGDSMTYYACRRVIYDQNGSYGNRQIIGTCLAICSSEPLYQVCSSTTSSAHSILVILDEDQQIIARNPENDNELSSDIILSILSAEKLSISEKIDGKTYLINQLPALHSTRWKVSSIVPYSDINSDLLRLQALALLFIVVLLLAFFTLIRRITKNITHPLLEIVSFVQNDPYYTLHHRLELHEPREIDQLSSGINQMIDQINELNHTVLHNQARLYEIELANNQARLSALQSQINPHFLYNTLDAIHGLAYLGKQEEIRTTIQALSFILRYSIKGEEYVSVKEELKCVHKYLEIIDVRFSKKIKFQIQVENEILNYHMPRFLLQPLVENAVFHGLEPRIEKGSLTLTGSLTENHLLHFECKDDGIGIAEDKLKELNSMLQNTSDPTFRKMANDKIGLLNIHLRIQLRYGTSYGLSIVSKENQGTSICLDFPADTQ